MLHRPKVVICIAVLGLGLTMVLLPSRINDQLKRVVGWSFLPLMGSANGVEELGRRSRAYLTPRSILLAEIDRLRQENRRFRIWEFQWEQQRLENARLRAMVAWKTDQSWDLKLARVIIEDPTNWWRGAILDLGSKDGLAVDQAVLTEQGLVGKVVQVGPTRSKVSLVGDPNCRVAAVLGGSQHGGIVTSSRRGAVHRRIVELQHLPSDADLEPGTEILTSGAGGVFPKGIPIARLLDSQSYEFGLYSGARVRLLADLERLDLVWVITNRAGEEGGTK